MLDHPDPIEADRDAGGLGHADVSDDLSRFQVDADDPIVEERGHPKGLSVEGQHVRDDRQRDRLGNRVRRRIDSSDRALGGVGDPDACLAGSDPVGVGLEVLDGRRVADLDQRLDLAGCRVDTRDLTAIVEREPDRAFGRGRVLRGRAAECNTCCRPAETFNRSEIRGWRGRQRLADGGERSLTAHLAVPDDLLDLEAPVG